jgi:hypothetical protein
MFSGVSVPTGQDSLIRVLLGVKILQSELISFLLEKIPDYITDQHERSIQKKEQHILLQNNEMICFFL